MSLAVNQQVQPELVLDKRLGFENKRKFGIIKSGRSNTFKVLPTQNYSQSQCTFNAQPPSPNIAIDRQIMTKWYITLTFTGTAGSNGLLLAPSLYDAPRAFPVSQCISNIQANINNANVSLTTYQAINAFIRTNTTDDELRKDFSLTPSMLDFFQEYDDPYVFGYGIANDPLQQVGQNGYFVSRGGFPFTVVSNTATTAVVTFSSSEPMVVSPFLSNSDNEVALIGVQTLTAQINFNNLNRCWSHSNGNGNAGTITSCVASFTQAPEMLLNFLTPSDLQDIPVSNIFNYNTVDFYPYDTGITLAPGATAVINSQNIQFGYIPRRIYIFARRTDASATISTTDTFLRINGAQISFDNIAGVLSGANSEQLWNLSKESGLNMSWSEWSKYTGSILVLDIGRGLFLQSPDEAPSLSTTKQFQVQLNVTNINQQNSIPVSLQIMTIADGLITIEGGNTILQNTVLTRDDILNAGQNPTVNSLWEKSNSWFGGGGLKFRDISHKLKNAHNAVKSSGALSTIAALSGHPESAILANALGYGGALVGGKKMSKASLASRLAR